MKAIDMNVLNHNSINYYHHRHMMDNSIAASLSIKEGYIRIIDNTIHNLKRLYCTVKICNSFLLRVNFPQRNRYPFFHRALNLLVTQFRCTNEKFTSQPVAHFFTVNRAIRLPSLVAVFAVNNLSMLCNTRTKSILDVYRIAISLWTRRTMFVTTVTSR